MDAFEALAVSSSVPFCNSVTGAEPRVVLLTGVVPPDYEPHLERALVELPVAMLSRAALEYSRHQQAEAVRVIAELAQRFGAQGRFSEWLNG